MARQWKTILAIAIVAGAAILLARQWLKPAGEQVEQRQDVLTGAYAVQVEECRVLEDSELDETLARPRVGEDLVYIEVVLLYPEVDQVPEPDAHRLDRINGHLDTGLEAVHAHTELTDEGTLLLLTFRTDSLFRYARLLRGKQVLLERVGLDE